jgi:DNA-binding winged helix-turn-helix (wHTH) protein
MIGIDCFQCDDAEMAAIRKTLKTYEDIRITRACSLFSDADLFLLPTRELAATGNEGLGCVNQPVLSFGPLVSIHVALAFSITDFITYPFQGDELPARIYKAVPMKFFFTTKCFFTIHADTLRCRGIETSLRYQEFMLLKALIALSPEPVDREQLEMMLHSNKSRGGRSLDMTISKLRKKLSAVTQCDNEMIIAERGYGYRIIQPHQPFYKNGKIR